ncbi:hypothetical protein HRM2_48960 [Desulforapulum autotrophicum HRM2]|uniref:Uncharacterized protein n=1 Tax=Desulforapulum autotrophicum (strain ATCC 43914 / DSM 3382 / VKM B-1955 / HRM2) TaxID=177437 RepID=C0QIK0_DESAH|nr:hypothetical protein HRM2_48960 [Desulforapulum autotrophicum HRM2]
MNPTCSATFILSIFRLIRFRQRVRDSEKIKFTIWLVFLLVFFVASIGTYSNMLQLMRLEDKQKSSALLVYFKISEPLNWLNSGALFL